ncbi:MAG: hypothetical protein IPG60_11245 [Bacteroidetes bacterium]|nr:hypothetical protein [Bacteroidota bacterium]MBP9188443.1 hypothetical protein [Chitinophagales bacterium]
MVIVIVRWYIKKEQDKKFKATWQGMNPKYKEGLFREFFSKPISKPDEKYHTLDVESKHYTTYINVGVWRKLDDFNKAIGSMIPGRTKSKDPEKKNKELIEVFDFEFKLRERIVMNVERTRGGEWKLPPINF